MHHMLKKANEKGVRIQKRQFQEFGKGIDYFKGVEDWFERINQYGKDNNVKVQHYIVSSGLKEMIEGTSIANNFTRIYASSFMYDQHEIAIGPALAINYTTKTQFIFRINKGVLEVHDNSKINDFQLKEERDIPFERMIFLGDGDTDVPCMKLVKEQGGYSIAVYKPGSSKAKTKAQKLVDENRVDFVSQANFNKEGRVDKVVKTLIDRVANGWKIEKFKRNNK